MPRPVTTKKPSKKTPRVKGPDEPEEVTRYITPAVTAMLWGRAGGRCEFAGCNPG